jgi:hypothetical protein
MADLLTSEEQETQRLPGQWSDVKLAIPEYHVKFTAILAEVPVDNDMVAELEFIDGDGDISTVLPDMTLYVGSTAGAYDLGICRIRKNPVSGCLDTGTLYVGETSEIQWGDTSPIYLTVVDDYSLWQKSLRIVDEEPFMDWDVEYDDQHLDFDPTPCMGGHRVKELIGASVDVRLGKSADTAPFVFDSTIASVLWTIEGATLDDDTSMNPVATFTEAGTYLAYCNFIATSGKEFQGVRYVIIYDDDHPLIENFTVTDGVIGLDKGGCSFGVTLFSNQTAAVLRKRTLVIIVSDDYAETAAITLPAHNEGEENIICAGWISDIENSRNSETGQISFQVESSEFWLKQIRDFPSGLELQVTAAGAWTAMPGLNIDRAAWHFLHWRSTATRIMDVQLTEDDRLASRFQTARATLWDRLIQIAAPTIFGRPFVDRFGRFFLKIEQQMLDDTARGDIPEIMTLIDDDFTDSIRWVNKDVKPLAMLFFSAIRVNSTNSANSFFAMSPGHSYLQHGGEEPQDNYLALSQAQTEAMCGAYFGWRNNTIPNIDVEFTHSFRYLSIFPYQYYPYTVSAQNDPRGIGFECRLIPREIRFQIDTSDSFFSISAVFELESTPGPAIEGDIPGMEGIDFSIPDLPNLNLTPLPPLPPLVEIPPTILNPAHPKKFIVTFEDEGVFYTENGDDEDPDNILFNSFNEGLDDDDIAGISDIVVTPNGVVWLVTNKLTGILDTQGRKRIYYANALGGTWQLYYDYDQSDDEQLVTGIAVNPNAAEEIAFHTSMIYIPPVFGGMFHGSYFHVGDRSGYNDNLIPHDAPIELYGIREFLTGIVLADDQWFLFGSRAGGIYDDSGIGRNVDWSFPGIRDQLWCCRLTTFRPRIGRCTACPCLVRIWIPHRIRNHR